MINDTQWRKILERAKVNGADAILLKTSLVMVRIDILRGMVG